MGLSPTRSPKFSVLLMALTPLRDDCELNSAIKIALTRVPKFIGTTDGITPTWKTTMQTHKILCSQPTLLEKETKLRKGMTISVLESYGKCKPGKIQI